MLIGCSQTVVINPPSANAPSECANLQAERSRRLFAYNAESSARQEASRANPAGDECPAPNFLRQRMAKLSAIVALADAMNAKGCYQHPINDTYNRNLIERQKARLAKCSAQTAATQAL